MHGKRFYTRFSQKCRKRQKHPAGGTSLLELLMVMFMFNILLGSIYSLYKVSVDSWDVGLSRLGTISGGRGAMQKIVWELATARKTTFDPGFSELPLSATTLEFSNEKSETIRYYNWVVTQEQPLRMISRMIRANITKGDNPDKGDGTPLGNGRMAFVLEPDGMVDIAVTSEPDGGMFGTKVYPRN